MSSTAPASTQRTLSADEATRLIAALQGELAGVSAKVASLEETIANLAHENELLKRRIYGNKTERSHTSELQLALGDLLAAEAQLQKQLDAAVAPRSKLRVAKGAGRRRTERAKAEGRRDLLASKLPRFLVEILDEELEERGCRQIGFEDSEQLMFRRGGFVVLVKRVAKYEVGAERHDDGVRCRARRRCSRAGCSTPRPSRTS